jgi:triacylglycerol esterase/lipase EstA (alpha/beta hydrolase family)
MLNTSKVKAMTALAALAALIAIAAPAGASASSFPVNYGATAFGESVTRELYTPTLIVGGNNGCKPSSAHPYPVVLVIGTTSDEGANFVSIAPLLANNGYCVYSFNYGETLLSDFGRIDALNYIEHSAEELSGFVNNVLSKTGASKVDLVGHSQGGMMPNYYIKFLGGASKVNELVGLAPSNHGTTLDGLEQLLEKVPGASLIGNLVEFLGAPALTQQEEGSTFMKKLFGGGEPVVSGVRYVVIESTHDEVVTPYTNAFLNASGVVNITLQNQCPTDPVGHIGMASDSPVLQNMLNQLSQSPNSSFKATCTSFGVGF